MKQSWSLWLTVAFACVAVVFVVVAADRAGAVAPDAAPILTQDFISSYSTESSKIIQSCIHLESCIHLGWSTEPVLQGP